MGEKQQPIGASSGPGTKPLKTRLSIASPPPLLGGLPGGKTGFLGRFLLGRENGFGIAEIRRRGAMVGALGRRPPAGLGPFEDKARIFVHIARKRFDLAVSREPEPVGDQLDQRAIVGDEDDGAFVVVERVKERTAAVD